MLKKIRRLSINLPNKESGLDFTNEKHLKYRLAREVTDSIIYGLIILSILEIDSSEIISDTFDDKSREYGFPERAPR